MNKTSLEDKMTTAAERKYMNIRKRLDQLGYRQTLTVECLPLVEKLFSDLVHTTESLRKSKLSAVKAEKESANFDFVLEPYKLENARLSKENNELYLELMKLREQSGQHIKELKTTLKKCARETTDLKFLNNQYVHKLKLLEKESKAKNEKIQQLQEKNLQAIVQTPGGKKRSIAFRRQRMQIDEPVPPSEVSSYPVPQPDDPYIADLLQVADNRIQELQQEVYQLQEKLAVMESGLRDYNKQVDFLQQANKDLEKHIQELMETKETVTTEVVNLSNKNEKLCQELTEIDQLAQQLERHKEEVLETADKELEEAKKEIKKKLSEMRNLEETMGKLQLELNLCHKEKERLSDELLIKSDLETVVHQLEQEKQRLNKKIESFAVTERELTLEVERMRLEHGIKRRDKSPSRLDTFLKGIEDERDFYKKELERLQHLIQRRSCSRSHSTCEKIPVIKTLEKGDYNSEIHVITRERDELQHMLERFEKHMEDIQSNVKLLTAERDKLSVLYNEAQEELSALRQESAQTTVSHNTVSLMEKEKELALSDLRRIMAEREALKEKLKNLHEMSILGKSELEKTVEHLTCVNHQLENEKCELKSKMLKMKETIESLEKKVKLQAQKLSHVAGDSSHQKTEMNSLRLVNEQLQRSLEDHQHQLSMKRSELESAQAQVKILEEKIDKLHFQMTSQNEEAHVMKKTIGVIDKEKDILQETVDEKTEKIANLHENLANKEKAITQMKITVSEYESSMNHLKETLINRDREISSLRRQLDAAHKELDEVGRSKEMSFKENRRLQDDLATVARENQQISLELEAAVQEKEEMKSRVHNYITEVSRWESLMASKERENQDLLDRFQMLHDRAEDWEVKAHQAEGESSSVRLELLSIDTERRHLRERVELLEKEIQEHINAHHAYESQISSMAKAMSRLEEELRHQEDEKAAVLNDVSSLRDLCIKLDSGKDIMTQQLNSKNLEFERVAVELENVKSESELLKKQLSSERHTIKNLESLLATNRDKEFHSHLTFHEKDTEIQLLKEKLTLSESKLNSQSRENTMLRAKMAQLQTDLDVLKRQISTERYERERAIQEMRRHGLRTPPLSSTLKSPLHSPEHTN
ncbi:centrosomal protein of 135 kDa isoform X3 [Sagmatias obliquidens]|uniref:centrosomal protein of 135 kDa isoform X3 n=1 Tax=Sagmatias obliquidens TaxID=3371155 RepID=UPI000F44668D|nr:centrosomal protein of 135 kDa isoform X3 [Lagenorhynchus obliquidens]